MTKKQIDRYNELLLKFLGNDEFMELLDLVLIHHTAENTRGKLNGTLPIEDPYRRLIYDLENREETISRRYSQK